jgi:outer membrane receptor protein involved in Fe transport
LLNAGSKDKYKGSLNLNWRTGKVNLFGNYDFNLRNFSFDGTSNRIFNNKELERFNEDNSSMRMKAHLVKAGIDYSLDNTTTLNLSGRFSNRNRSGNDASITRIFDADNNNTTLYNSFSTESDKGYNYDVSTSFLKRFKNQGQNLTADVNFSYETEDETETTEINYTLPDSYISRSRQFTDEISKDLRAQIDYVHPFKKERKFETGTKYIYRDRNIDYRFENFDTTQNIFSLNTDVSNVFKYRENILALYNTYTDKIGNLGYQLGLRGEYTYSLGDLLTTGETFKQNYFDLFPSVSLSYTIATGSEVQASYSRRVERPRHRQLNPFLDISDPTNLQKGNPALKPEYIDSYELGYLQYIGNISVTPSLFYRVTNDRMARQRIYLDSITTLNTFVNYDKSTAYGAELLVNGQITRWWGVNGSLSWFETEIDASNVGLGSTRKRSTWTTRLSTSMRLPNIANLQVNYMYTGKMYTAQGYIEPMQTLDLALNRDIIQDRLNLALRVTDVFNTMQYKHVFEDQQSNEFVIRKRESRNVFLTMTYKFGQEEKQRNRRNRNQDDQEDMPDFDDF